jgi:hypothetical protein
MTVEESEHLAGDGAFESAHDVAFGAAVGELADYVGAGAGVVGHADQVDAVHGVDGGAVTPRENRWRMVLPELAGTGPLPAACPSEQPTRIRSAQWTATLLLPPLWRRNEHDHVGSLGGRR